MNPNFISSCDNPFKLSSKLQLKISLSLDMNLGLNPPSNSVSMMSACARETLSCIFESGIAAGLCCVDMIRIKTASPT